MARSARDVYCKVTSGAVLACGLFRFFVLPLEAVFSADGTFLEPLAKASDYVLLVEGTLELAGSSTHGAVMLKQL